MTMTNHNHCHYHRNNTATVDVTSTANKTKSIVHTRNHYGSNDDIIMAKGLFIQSSSVPPHDYYHNHHHHGNNAVDSWFLDQPRNTIAWSKFTSSCFCFPVFQNTTSTIDDGTKTNECDCFHITTRFRDDDSSFLDMTIAKEHQGGKRDFSRNNYVDSSYSIVSDMSGSETSSYLSFSDETDNDDDDDERDDVELYFANKSSHPLVDDGLHYQTIPPRWNSSESIGMKPSMPGRSSRYSNSSSSSSSSSSITNNNINNVVLGASNYSFASLANYSTSNRQRTDTGEFTRGSAATNASRHRRSSQEIDKAFTDQSITEMIWNDNDDGDGPKKPFPLPQPQQEQQSHPSFVTYQEAGRVEGQRSTISEVRRRQGGGARNRLYSEGSALGVDNEESFDSNDDDLGSPFAFLKRKLGVTAIETPKQTLIQQQSQPQRCLVNRHHGGDRLLEGEQRRKQECFPLQDKDNKRQKKTETTYTTTTPTGNDSDRTTPIYQRKNLVLDNATIEGRLVLSSWIVVLFETKQILQKEDNNQYSQLSQSQSNVTMPRNNNARMKINVDDLYYLRVVVGSSSSSSSSSASSARYDKKNERAYLILHRSRDGAVAHTFKINENWILESIQMPDEQMGRSILIRHSSSNCSSSLLSSSSQLLPKAIDLTDSMWMLPVALSDGSFNKFGEMIRSNDNSNNDTSSHHRQQPLCEHLCSPNGPFAPDEQLDAATHIFFTVDSFAKCFGDGIYRRNSTI